jgi:DNA invertase Pin-like site-specific DNA recombinase
VSTGKFVSYLRVSTDKQGRSGLGIEAQREAVERYLNGGDWKLVAEYVETESGRKPQRPKLTAALAHAKAIGATVIIAKLDRLTRNVDVLRSLVASGAGLVFCDLPQIPDGAMGRFMLTQMASVAELEAGLISERTKAALRAARKRIAIEGQRGHRNVKRLGNPYGARALRGKHVGNDKAVVKVKANADQHAQDLRPIIRDIRDAGITSARAIADELTKRGVLTSRGGKWHRTSVVRLLDRLALLDGQRPIVGFGAGQS